MHTETGLLGSGAGQNSLAYTTLVIYVLGKRRVRQAKVVQAVENTYLSRCSSPMRLVSAARSPKMSFINIPICRAILEASSIDFFLYS